MVDDIAVQEFVNAIKEPPTDVNTTYSAIVSRIDNEGIVWVRLQGGDRETPTASVASEVSKGDSVSVQWRGNKLYINGNYTNPSAGTENVKQVEVVADKALSVADEARIAADSAVNDAERARVAAESAEADAASAARSASSAGENASRAQAASQAAQAAALASLTTDTIHYLATSQGSGVTRSTAGWTTTVQTIDSTNKYLWTYHTYTSAGGSATDTDPVITGTYGERGADGTSVTILGSYNTLAELQQAHPTGSRGDSYMVAGDLYVWNGSAWENVGQIRGQQGEQGVAGTSVTVSSISYAVTTTESEPASYPYSTAPTVPEGSWLWTKISFSDGTSAVTKSKQGVSGTNGRDGTDGRDGINGTNGRDGTDGVDGADGISVTAVQPQYYLSISASEATGGSWATTLTYVIGKFIWTRDYITYSNNTYGTSTAIYNEALTQSCYNAATALGLVQEQQEYFWHDSLGAHVLSSTDTSGTRYRTDIKGAGLEINQLSSSTETSIAAFGSTTRVGAEADKHITIDSSGFNVYVNSSTAMASVSYGNTNGESGVQQLPYYVFAQRTIFPYTYVRKYGCQEGTLTDYNGTIYRSNTAIAANEAWTVSHWDLANGGYAFAEGMETIASGHGSHAEGHQTIASNFASHAEGNGTIASYAYSHAEGSGAYAFGICAHAEGNSTTAEGGSAHAEGQQSRASGAGAHAEGFLTKAYGSYSHAEGHSSETASTAVDGHAEGYNTRAEGGDAHAEGFYSQAVGDHSHAQNCYTVANGNSQTTIGKFNIADTTNALIIGNGANENSRSNALTVDWQGNVEAAGEIRGATSKTVITAFSSGWDVYSTDPSAPITLRRCGKVIDLTGAIKNTTAVTLTSTQVTIFTIPEGYRPSQTMTILSQGSSMNVFAIRIKASGEVTFERYRSTNSTSTSYLSIDAGAWFPIHATWIMD